MLGCGMDNELTVLLSLNRIFRFVVSTGVVGAW
jgi:hypothetical protein